MNAIGLSGVSMDNHVRNVYLMEAVTQCKFALNAIRGLNHVLPRLMSPENDLNYELQQTLHDEVFRSLHSFLTHASNVSRLLWPANPVRRKTESPEQYRARCMGRPAVSRGLYLRQATGLSEDHALKSRELRDHLEHFDERLDDWAANSKSKNYVQDLIGGRNAIVGVDEKDMMRWFDPSAKSMRFRGVEYNLEELADGVADVSERCTKVLQSFDDATSLNEIVRMPRREAPGLAT